MRLLLIEDNQRLADYLGTALQNGGFAIDHVTTTGDAESALSATHYDTILLDLGLPDMDGLVWLGHQRRRQMTRPVRRPGEALGVKLTAGNVMLNTSEREVSVAGEPVEFGRREIDGLELLMRRAGRVVPKSAIEDAIYSFGEDLASNAIEVLVHRIRRRLQEAGADMHIHTLRGVGYVLSAKATND
jgi:DNA-binding response OmpR family regulator